MSAQTQTPSQETTKLKLFLEKNKQDFLKKNSDILDWLQDRDLKIEKLGLLNNLEEKNEQTTENSVESKVISQLKNKSHEANVSFEEYHSIFEKLVNLLSLPAGQLEDQSELYLEQQLSDLLGFDVVAQLDDQTLKYSTGIMSAEPHLKRFPNDELKNHENVLEAGMDKHRSSFGWFIQNGTITPEDEELEKYYISLQLHNLEEWRLNYKNLKKWYRFRKIIVINPAERIAVATVVGNINYQNQLKTQFGASPEVIREGCIWSPKSQGKVLLMFIDDPHNKIPLGPIYFDKLFKS